MRIAASADDTARAILRALVVRLKVRGGQGALLRVVIQNAQSEGVESQDFEAGLKHAIEQGWIGHDSPSGKHWVGLTDAGFTECSAMKKIRAPLPHSADYYLEKAQELRERALASQSSEAGDQLRNIATEYERLATFADSAASLKPSERHK
jgi:hypothetical protein